MKNRINTEEINIRVSIIIPTRNEIATLSNLHNCLKKQTFMDCEILVADSSNNDSTQKLCNALRLSYIRGGHPGKARNEGAKLSLGEYLLFLDADVLIEPSFIEQAITHLVKFQLDAISFNFLPTTNDILLKVIHRIASKYFRLTSKTFFPHGLGGALLVRKEIHQRIDGFDESITVAEDQDYIQRLSKKYKYDFVETPIVNVSARRFYKNGTFKVCATWVLIELHRIFIGEIRHNMIPYHAAVEE